MWSQAAGHACSELERDAQFRNCKVHRDGSLHHSMASGTRTCGRCKTMGTSSFALSCMAMMRLQRRRCGHHGCSHCSPHELHDGRSPDQSYSLDRLDDDTNFAIGCPEHRGPDRPLVISVRSSLQAPACSAALTGTTRKVAMVSFTCWVLLAALLGATSSASRAPIDRRGVVQRHNVNFSTQGEVSLCAVHIYECTRALHALAALHCMPFCAAHARCAECRDNGEPMSAAAAAASPA
jgi:hypothetical protein